MNPKEIELTVDSLLEAERERIRQAMHDLPIHFVDVRFHPDEPEKLEWAVTLSDAIAATFPVDKAVTG